VADSNFLDANQELEIKIEMDPEKKTLSIIDTGIGMTKSDLINNLGTVAKSGTNNFLEAMNSEQQGDSNLIGQFGVGFYSAFLVADKVTVTSKNNEDQQYTWESTADASFTITEDDTVSDKEETSLGRGTRVTMHLKEDAMDYLMEDTVRGLIKKFSQFVNFPIYLQVRKEIEVEADDEDLDIDQDIDDDEEDVEVEDGDDEKKGDEKKEKKKEIVKEWDLVNSQKAIWVRPKEEITPEEYTSFYQAITKDTNEPLAHTHFKAEGDNEFKSLLYIPSKAEHDLMQSISNKKSDIKMYVRRVLVGEEIDELVPRYLNWVKGVVDSDDLPLNVSREQLQQSKVMKVISKKLTRKILDMLKKISDKSEEEDDEEEEETTEEEVLDTDDSKSDKQKKQEKSDDEYLKIWNEFGEALKWGTFEDDANRNKLMKLLRFQTSKSDGKFVSLQSVVKNMKDSQKKIYFISGDDTKAMLKNPSMQMFNKKGVEVLLLTGNNDEHVIQRANEFEGKQFASVQKAGIDDLEDDEDAQKKFKAVEKQYKKFTEWTKTILDEQCTDGDMVGSGIKVDSVKISNRLVSSPMVVVASQFGYSPKMEAMMSQQTGGNMDIMKMMSERKVIEINPYHPIVDKLFKMYKKISEDETSTEKEESSVKSSENNKKQAKTTLTTLFQTALIQSGFQMTDPSSFVDQIQQIMADSMKIEDVNALVDIEILEEEEEVVEEKKIDEDDIEEIVTDEENNSESELSDEDMIKASSGDLNELEKALDEEKVEEKESSCKCGSDQCGLEPPADYKPETDEKSEESTEEAAETEQVDPESTNMEL